MTDGWCVEGIRRAARSLRRAFDNGADKSARLDMAIAGLFGGLALASIALSFVSGGIMLLNKILRGVSMIQSPLLLFSAMLFMIGIQLLLMGFLAEIAVRTYHESQAKPTYVVRRVVMVSRVVVAGPGLCPRPRCW